VVRADQGVDESARWIPKGKAFVITPKSMTVYSDPDAAPASLERAVVKSNKVMGEGKTVPAQITKKMMARTSRR
jgi:hypothetical protein